MGPGPVFVAPQEFAPRAVAPETQTSGALALAPAAPANAEDPIALWRALLDRVRRHRPSVAASLELAAPRVVTRDKIVLGFEDGSFEDARAEQTDAEGVLAEQARAFFGGPTQIAFEIARGSKGASVAYLDMAKKKQEQAEARAAIENHSLVKKAIEIFEAELRDVKLPVEED
jgi:hypothetical protein